MESKQYSSKYADINKVNSNPQLAETDTFKNSHSLILYIINVDAVCVYLTTSWLLSSSVGVTGADDGVGVTSAVAAVCRQSMLRHRKKMHTLIVAAYFWMK